MSVAMYVEVAEIDIDNWRSTTHAFSGVLGFDHVRGDIAEGEHDRVYITLENGTETIVGRGYGLEVVCAEQE